LVDRIRQQAPDGSPVRVCGVGRQVQGADECSEWPVSIQLLGTPSEDLEAAGFSILQDLGQEPSLPDSRLSLDEGGSSGSMTTSIEQLSQNSELIGPSDEPRGLG
jgi:hypothetical protein